MQQAKRGSRVAAVVLTAWLLAAVCPTGVAQEAFRPLPATRGDLAYQTLARSAGDSADDSSSGEPASKSPPTTWMQRIAGLARGRTQLEGGYSLLHDSAGGSSQTQHAFPDLLLRFGLTDRLELRLGWPGYIASNTNDSTFGGRSNGTLDPNVGLVYDLWSQHGLLPQTAVLAAVPLTLQGDPFSLNSLQPLSELMYAWQTTDRTAITGRSGFAVFDAAGDNYTQFRQSLILDVILTERLGGFFSWDMLADHGSWNDSSQHMAGGGVSYLLTERLAVTWRSAVGLNAAAPDFLNDVRFAYRF